MTTSTEGKQIIRCLAREGVLQPGWCSPTQEVCMANVFNVQCTGRGSSHNSAHGCVFTVLVPRATTNYVPALCGQGKLRSKATTLFLGQEMAPTQETHFHQLMQEQDVKCKTQLAIRIIITKCLLLSCNKHKRQLIEHGTVGQQPGETCISSEQNLEILDFDF